MQPILFVRSLPYLAIQLSVYGVNFLKRPVVWLALGVHGALLVLPAVDLSAPQEEEVVEEVPEEDPTIGAVSLSDILAPPEPVAPVEELEAPDASPPAPSAEPPVLTEIPEEIEQLPDEEDLDENLEDTSEEDEQKRFLQEQQNAFQSGLNSFIGFSDQGSDVDNTADWFINDPIGLKGKAKDAELIQNAGGILEAFFTSASIASGTYEPLNANGFKVIGISKEDVERGGLGDALANSNMTIQVLGDYGGYPLQGIVAANGQVISYLTLIELAGKTLVFSWTEDPR